MQPFGWLLQADEAKSAATVRFFLQIRRMVVTTVPRD